MADEYSDVDMHRGHLVISAVKSSPLIIISLICPNPCIPFCQRDISCIITAARSPLYSHISTTLQGLPTIRIFGKEYIASNLFHQFLNSHTQAWWLYLASVRWFSMRVDIISALFTAVVAFTSLPLASGE